MVPAIFGKMLQGLGEKLSKVKQASIELCRHKAETKPSGFRKRARARARERESEYVYESMI